MEITPDSNDRKLAAIMFIDIFNYSKMMGEDEAETLKLLNDYESLVKPIIDNFGGTVVKELGDGWFCEFNSALRASECGLKIHKDLSNFNQTSQNKFEINVRIGIHLGDVIRKGTDLIGDGVNVAARIEPLAKPGGICISESVYQTIRNHPDFKLESLGKIALKNIAHPHNIYKIITGYEKKEYYDSAKEKQTVKKSELKESGTFENETSIKKKSISKIIFTGFILIILLYIISILLKFELFQTENIDTERVDNIIDNLPHKSHEFIKNVLILNSSQALISFLENKSKSGELVIGNKDNYANLDNKIVIIVDEEKIYSVLIYKDSLFFDYVKREKYPDLSKYYKGKRTIWIELF
jgi:class 3 adenylate cyclase